MKTKWLSFPYLVWMCIFIVVPLVLVLIFSLTTDSAQGGREVHLTFDNFKRFMDPIYLRILGKSIYLAFISTLVCLLLGYPMSMIIAKENIKKRNVMILLFIVPMWINFLLRTYAWMTLLGKNGFINFILQKLGLAPLNLLYNDKAILLGMIDRKSVV